MDGMEGLKKTRGRIKQPRKEILVLLALILLVSRVNCATIHAWDFKTATASNFVDTGSGTTQNIAQTTDYIDNDYGVHLSYQKISLSTADIFNDLTFTIYGSFYSHESSSFYLFCEQNGAVDRFCLSANSAGYYALSMVNSAGSEQYLVSTIQARTGVNFFYIQVWQEFGYTKMSLNVANENNSPTKSSETLTFNGVYTKSSQTFNIGCRVVNSACTFPFNGAIRSLSIDDTVIVSATLDALYSTTCNNDGITTCGLCIVSGTGKCIEVLETTPKTKYLSLNIAAATTSTTSILDTSGDSHNFGLSTDFPFRVPEQGYVFAKDKHLQATAGFTLPEIFTVNTWFRLNTNITVPDTQMQYLYLKTNAAGTSNLFFIGVTNTYLRIYIDGGTYDYTHAFSSNGNWRYLSVGFYKTSASTTGIQIFLDSTKVATQSIPKAFTDNAAYNVYVGKDLEGAINTFEIVPLLYTDLTVPPLLVTSGCTAYGSTSSCTVCPRTGTAAGTCLSHCSFGTYDNTCNACDWKCEYCTAAGANCISCGISLDGTGAAPRTCTCRNGYYDNTTSCEACNSLCGTCNGALSTNCLTCADSAFLNGVSTCVSSCPTYYSANANLRKCQLDTASLLTYVYDATSQANGCTSSQYWDGSACQSCHGDCLTCSGSANTNCLSCPLGKYLNSNQCLVCDVTHMTLGSSGLCVETCGKSRNYGLLACDNGGATGCTSCVVEDGYTCSGGSPTGPDTCSYTLGQFADTAEATINSTKVTIKEIVATEKNNIYVYFDREMKAVGNITSDTFTIEVTESDGTAISGVSWGVPNSYYTEYATDGSARYIYIALSIPKTLEGGSNAANVTVTYHNVTGTGAFRDLNNQFLLDGTSATGQLNIQYAGLAEMDKLLLKVFGNLVSFFLVLGVGVIFILGFKGGSTEGLVLTIVSLQAIYFSSLIDFTFPPLMSGFMEYLRTTRFELDSLPNIFIEYIINEGSKSEYLVRTNDMNFYKIANVVEFNSLKLLILIIFNSVFIILSLCLLCCKKRRPKIHKILETMRYKGFLLLFVLMFVPFGFSCFGEEQNIRKTSPYKIVSSASAFLFIFITYLSIFTISKIIISNSILTDKKVQERFNILQIGTKKTKKITVMFYPLIFVKMVVITLMTVHLNASVSAFGILIFLIQLSSVSFFIYARPFLPFNSKSKLRILLNPNSLCIISESLVGFYYFLFTLYSDTSPALTQIISTIQMALVGLLVIHNSIIGIYCSYKNLIRFKVEKLSQFNEEEMIKKHKLDELEEYEFEEEEEEEEMEEEVEEESEEEIENERSGMETKELNITKPTEANMHSESQSISRSSKRNKGKNKKRTKAKIGYVGDNRINVFDSIESDNTEDHKY